MKRHILHDLSRNILMIVVILLFTISAAGAAPNRGLAVPNDTLPAELKGLPIQDTYTGSGANAVGEIQSVVGHVVVFREDKQYAYFAAPKDKIFERDVVYTLNASRCRFQLYSSDTATMAENTRILIKTYINNRNTGMKSTAFFMKKGKAMFYALRLFMYKGSSMEVETPTAVSGVRGTKWGVEVVENKERASLPILVADASDLGAFRQLAQANTGGGGFTIVHSFEGTVFVTGTTGSTTTLYSGQSLQSGEGGLGNPYPTPPGASQQFQSDTSAPGGTGGSGGSGGSGGGDSGGGAGSGSTGSQTPPDTSSLIQDQNLPAQNRTPTKFGYYVGMRTKNASIYDGTFFGSPKPKDLAADDFAHSLDRGSSTPTKWWETGYNSYLTWGYWTQDTSWGGGPSYAFNNKGYYVAGDVTAAMPTSILGKYSGTANGTVWSAAGGTDYSGGTFDMNVNFSGGSGTVSDFNLAIASGNTGITGAHGNIASTGSFWVTDGSNKVNGSSVVGNTGNAYGSFYGPTGSWIGGAWEAYDPVGGHANGNFYGGTFTPGQTKFGYFVGMLTNTSSTNYATTYISKTLQDLGSSSAVASGDSTDKVTIAGFRSSNSMTQLSYNAIPATGVPQTIVLADQENNAYMAWGSWTQSTDMNISPNNYDFTNKGYYVMGNVTAAGNMPSTGTGTYAGTANGTVWSSAGDKNYTGGTFSMAVNFATASVSAFEVTIGDPANLGAKMTGGTGTITGNSFSVTGNFGSNIKIDGSQPTSGSSGSAYGSFYSPTGSLVGGVWQATTGVGGKYANGNFRSNP